MIIFDNETILRVKYPVIAGVDEAGRGPLAGPVVVAACSLPEGLILNGLDDSKKLNSTKREQLFDEITEKASAYSLVIISATVIDQINILQATLQGMSEAVNKLDIPVNIALIDGNQIPHNMKIPCMTIVKGDSSYASIAAASILAKVTRDKIMQDLHLLHPEYGFDKHKGYPTKLHLDALYKYGVSEHHRKSYKPVRDLLIQKEIMFQ